MELKASRKSREDHDKICARITSCLYIYLGIIIFLKIVILYRNKFQYTSNEIYNILKIFLKNLHISLSEHSMDYLLDTLMKIQFMCRSYHHILDPIIT